MSNYPDDRSPSSEKDASPSTVAVVVAEVVSVSEPPQEPEAVDPDRALKIAVAAALATGDYHRAERLLEILKESRPVAPVLSLKRGGGT